MKYRPANELSVPFEARQTKSECSNSLIELMIAEAKRWDEENDDEDHEVSEVESEEDEIIDL